MVAPDRNTSKYVLRLIVVKVEGVVVPSPGEWINQLGETGLNPSEVSADNLFSDWVQKATVSEAELRNQLPKLVRSGVFELNSNLHQFLDTVRNHTPVRVGFMSVGPREWVQALNQELNMKSIQDLTFHYDHYSHGSRRTLLQFLMNRFIAGKARTLLLGNTPSDEKLANKEETRFMSVEPPPDCSSIMNPGNWEQSWDDLEKFVHEKKPQE